MAYKKKTMTVKKLAKQVKKLTSIPDSKIYIVNTNSGPGLSGSIHNIHEISVGTSANQRTGFVINAQSVNVKAQFQAHASATNTFVKMLIVQDKQQVADTQPAVSDVIYSLGANSWLANKNYDTTGRFKILASHTFLQDGTNPRYYEKQLKLGFPIRYNGTGPTDIQKNGLYVIFISNQITFLPTINWSTHMTFYD